MKYCLSVNVFRVWLGVLLLSAVSSCTLYHKAFHPYRLPTPKPSPEFIAEQKKKKADEKLRNDLVQASASERRKSRATPAEAATDVATPSGMDAASASTASNAARTLPEKSTVRYDKQGLMKMPKMNRRKVHNYSKKGFHPIESILNFFKFGLHAKPNYDPKHRPAPKQPSDAPADKP